MKLLERIAMTFQLRSLIFLCYGLGDGKCESIPQMGFTYSYDYYVVCHRKFIVYSLTMKSDSSFYKGPIYFYTPQLDHLQWLLMELQFGFVSGLKRSFVISKTRSRIDYFDQGNQIIGRIYGTKRCAPDISTSKIELKTKAKLRRPTERGVEVHFWYSTELRQTPISISTVMFIFSCLIFSYSSYSSFSLSLLVYAKSQVEHKKENQMLPVHKVFAFVLDVNQILYVEKICVPKSKIQFKATFFLVRNYFFGGLVLCRFKKFNINSVLIPGYKNRWKLFVHVFLMYYCNFCRHRESC